MQVASRQRERNGVCVFMDLILQMYDGVLSCLLAEKSPHNFKVIQKPDLNTPGRISQNFLQISKPSPDGLPYTLHGYILSCRNF